MVAFVSKMTHVFLVILVTFVPQIVVVTNVTMFAFVTAMANIYMTAILTVRYAVAQWLRHCATNRKVVGSISDVIIGFFH
jgi:hypothetical protein